MSEHASQHDPTAPPVFLQLTGNMVQDGAMTMAELQQFAMDIVPKSVGNLQGDSLTGTELAPMIAWSSTEHGTGYAFAQVAGARTPDIYECAVGGGFEQVVRRFGVVRAICMGMVWLGDTERPGDDREGILMRCCGEDDSALEASVWYCEVVRTSLGVLPGDWTANDEIEPMHWTQHVQNAIVASDDNP